MQDKIKWLCYSAGVLVPALGRQAQLEPLELTYFLLYLSLILICGDSLIWIGRVGMQLRE